MRNLYLVQASNTYVGRGFKAAYLPYAVGLLAAYAFEDETIKSEYNFKRFIFTRERTDEAVQSLENPAVIGFSNYIWNTQYNLVLAEKVKKAFPECIIIFGGHNVPPDNSFLEKYPFIECGFEMINDEDGFLVITKCRNYEKVPPRTTDTSTLTSPQKMWEEDDLRRRKEAEAKKYLIYLKKLSGIYFHLAFELFNKNF